jgi:hypothetical protein
MEVARSDFTKYFDIAKAEYASGMDRSLAEARVGRESTIAGIKQATAKSMQSASARNAFSGMGQTSFGQDRITAIGGQGAMQEGMVREQYSSQLSQLEAQRAAGMSNLSTQMGSGLSAISQNQATNLSNIFQSYTNQAASMGMSGLNNEYQMRQQGLNGMLGINTSVNQNVGSGFQQWGNMASSIGGALMGNIGSMGGGGMSTPNTYSGQYTNQSGGDINGGYNSSGGAVGGR